MTKAQQVAKQCEVVIHLANALIEVHSDYARMFADGRSDNPILELTESVGRRTASFMETLGDMLNGMDAVSEEDEWTAPVFEEAHRLWPREVKEAAE